MSKVRSPHRWILTLAVLHRGHTAAGAAQAADRLPSAALQVLARLFEPFAAWMAPRYQAAVVKELKKYGLRYEDLYDPQYDLDVDEALKRLPQAVVDARNQRLKRASDISMKHSELPAEVQAVQKPLEGYMGDVLDLVRLENVERAELGTGRPYERHLP
jgi:ubiquinol-cytochrome c reductase subunit 7